MEFTIQETAVIFLAVVLIFIILASTLQGGTGLQGMSDFFAGLFGPEKGPDLTIENFRAENLMARDPQATVLFDVKNAGNINLPAGSLYTVKLYLDGELIHTWEPDKNIAKLPRSDRYELKKGVVIPSGEHIIMVVVDADKQIEELDEENNNVKATARKNRAPTATIDKICEHDVPPDKHDVPGEATYQWPGEIPSVSGTVTIRGTASDPDGNDEIESVKIKADWALSYSLYDNEATYDKDTGIWEIEWDTTKKLDYGGDSYESWNEKYHVVAIVEDKIGDHDNPDVHIMLDNEGH